MAKKRQKRMSSGGYEIGRLVEQSGGMVDDVVYPTLLNENEAHKLINNTLEEKGTVKPCKGRQERFAVPFDENNPVNGIGVFYKSDGTTRLVMAAGSKLYSDTPHVVTSYDSKDDWDGGTKSKFCNTSDTPGDLTILGSILGDAGNCEDATKWTAVDATLLADETKKKYDDKSLKITINSGKTVGFAKKLKSNLIVDNTKLHVLSAYVVNGNAGTGIRLVTLDANNAVLKSSSYVTATADFTKATLKLTASEVNAAVAFAVEVKGSAAQYAWVDGIILKQITQAEYDDSGYTAPNYDDLEAIDKVQTVTFQADWEAGNLANIDTVSVPDDIKIAVENPAFSDQFDTDAEWNEGSKTNIAVTSGNIQLTGGSTSVTETTQADFQTGTLQDVEATAEGDLQLSATKTKGKRISPATDLTATSMAQDSSITWNSTEPVNTSVEINTYVGTSNSPIDIDEIKTLFSDGVLSGLVDNGNGLELEKIYENGITSLGSTTRNSLVGDYEMGWEFTVGTSPITVTKLKVFHGTTRSVTINLWRVSDQAKLASVAVDAVDGSWVEGTITPVILSANTNYIVSVNAPYSGGYYRYDSNQPYNLSNKISFVQGKSTSSLNSYPSTTNSNIQGVADIVIEEIASSGTRKETLAINGTISRALIDRKAIIDATTTQTVVGSAYDTSGNGGRKLVRLDNGWFVCAVLNGAKTQIYYYVSKDNGSSWQQLCYSVISGAYTYRSVNIASRGNFVYALVPHSVGRPLCYAINVETQTNVDIHNNYSDPDTTSGNVGISDGASIVAYNGELYEAHSSKTSTYTNSYNIRYNKGTINADGSVTWGSVEQWTIVNTSGADYHNPCIIVINNIPYVVFAYNTSQYYIGIISKNSAITTDGFHPNTGLYAKIIYNGGTYAQSNPSATVDGNRKIKVAWKCNDSTGFWNVAFSESLDNGVTWSTKVTIIDHGSYSAGEPSITCNNQNKTFVVAYDYESGYSTYRNIYLVEEENGVWGTPVRLTTSTGHQLYPSACDNFKDFIEPLVIWKDEQNTRVAFYGKWYDTSVVTVEYSTDDVTYQALPNNTEFLQNQALTNLYLKQTITNPLARYIKEDRLITQFVSATKNTAITGLSGGASLTGKYLLIKERLKTDDASVAPKLHDLTWSIQSTFDANGTWESPILSPNAGLDGTLEFEYTAPVNTTVTLEMATSSDGTSWSVWSTVTAGSIAAYKYIKFRITLATTDNTITPMAGRLAISYSGKYYATAEWVGQVFDISDINPQSSKITWTTTIPTGTSTTVETRGSYDNVSWGNWEAQTNGQAISTLNLYNQARVKLNPNVAQTETPTVSELILTVKQDGKRTIWISPIIDASQASDKSTGHISVSSTPGAGNVVAQSRSSADNGVNWGAWVDASVDGNLNHTANNHVQIRFIYTKDASIHLATISFDGTPAAAELYSGLNPGGECFFTTLLDSFLIFNGIDAPKKWDGTNAVADLGGSPPRAIYIANHKNRLFAAHSGNNPSRLYFSDVLALESWPALNFIDISPNDGDFITGLLPYDDYLIITKQRSVWVLLGSQSADFEVRRIHDGLGNIAPRALVKVNELFSFVSTEGLYVSDLSKPLLLTERIKNTWSKLNRRRLNQAAAEFFDHKIRLDVPNGSSSVNNFRIVYDVLRKAIVLEQFNAHASCYTKFVEAGQEELLFGHAGNGQVSKGDIGTTDAGEDIISTWGTKHFNFGSSATEKKIRRLRLVLVKASFPVDIEVYLVVNNVKQPVPLTVTIPASDNSEEATIELSPRDIDVRKIRSLGYEIVQRTSNGGVKFHELLQEYRVGKVRKTS